MVQKASICVVATATGSTVEKTDEGIFTRTTFQIDNVAFGNPGSTITVRTPGGRIDNGKIAFAEVNAGSPLFLTGSQSLLLLDGNSGDYNVVGYSQGAISVVNTEDGAAVQLPDSDGGLLSVEAAVELIQERRNDGATNIVAQ